MVNGLPTARMGYDTGTTDLPVIRLRNGSLM